MRLCWISSRTSRKLVDMVMLFVLVASFHANGFVGNLSYSSTFWGSHYVFPCVTFGCSLEGKNNSWAVLHVVGILWL